MDPYAVVDVDAHRAIARNLDITLGVENLFNRQYTANWAGPLDYLGLPRTLRAGLSVRSF
jgi:outer membrane receptor protein involved in Fe transport